MAEQDLDRHLPATPYKLDQARRKGSVAKSPELATVALLGIAVVWCYGMAGSLIGQWVRISAVWWRGAGAPIDAQRAGSLMSEFTMAAVHLVAPFFLAIALASVLSHLLQSGPILSGEPLKPDFDRINPASGFQRLLSPKTLYLAFKTVLKLLLLAGVLWWSFQSLLDSLMGLSWVTPKAQVLRMPALFGGLLAKLWLVLLVLALIDLVYTRWEYARRMRMSARELKEEMKQREGDPRVRRRVRELRLERAKQTRALGQVRSADVVVTNPTRIAIALRYDRSVDMAPQLVAKGAGPMARQMRELASRHGVTIVQNAPLARALYRETDIGGLIPSAWYPAVAKILLWIYASRTAHRPAEVA